MKSLIKTSLKGAALAGALLSFSFATAQEASFTFSPASVEVYEGESFETQVLIETGNVPFTVFDLHLAFDTEYLQVMDIEIIEAGAFNYHVPAEFSNNEGRIDAAAFKTSADASAESLALVNITFVAVSPTELTQVAHIENVFPRSIIAYGGENVMGQTGRLDVSITGNALSDGLDSSNENFNLKIWPNPAKDFAQISFELASESQVRLDIFSPEGKLIDSIFEGNAQKDTPYQFEVEIGELAAGNYSCRLVSTEGDVVSKTLTVVK
ncbi:MAG TPA: T9SS type A sorting domain-containing protein [Cryomorphaceae bacterium]|nr:T9SS type A sorting domain-containing protein [Cryomorphaceae bacterium]